MSIRYAADELVTGLRITDTPRHRSATGYGRKIPTAYMLQYEGRWHRVYMMQYGNSGSAYLLKYGEVLFLEIETEYRIEKHREGGRTTDPQEGN